MLINNTWFSVLQKLLNDFLFPASRVVKQLKKNAGVCVVLNEPDYSFHYNEASYDSRYNCVTM